MVIDAIKYHDPAKAPGLIQEALDIAGSQKELAKRLGVTPKYLQHLRSGYRQNMSYGMQVMLEQIAKEKPRD